ncbi:hypothetical protein R6V09_22930 [Streptomyces sp. W16]|uniref:hypothetical protein n=1 Tax=Streptomyces sp. W16 TaxID=3076631 RepID=UPI00295B9BA7|nr:hypothetical protein [Streptomyces sp. W16]MDV9172957.1 hypothetical protein [Streptomyces sp. W16]
MTEPLRKLSGDPECKNGTCPTLWAKTASGDYVVQGYAVTDPAELAQLDLPEGETAVRVPAAVLEEYFSAQR